MDEELKDGPIEGENRPLCDYRSGKGQCCTKQADARVNGHNLCSGHKKYGNTMEAKTVEQPPKMGLAKPNEPEKSAQINKENAATEFANAQKPPKEPAFTKKHYYQRTCDLCDEIELHMNRFKKGEALAAAYQKARLILLSEMQGEPKDEKQEEIPLDTK